MSLLVDNIQWVLLVCGLLTFSLVQGVFAPRAVLKSYFGEAIDSAAAEMLTRNWAALVAIGGLFLIYAGFNPDIRAATLVVVGAGKLVFVMLILLNADRFLKGQALVAVIVDGLMVMLFATYLLATQPALSN